MSLKMPSGVWLVMWLTVALMMFSSGQPSRDFSVSGQNLPEVRAALNEN